MTTIIKVDNLKCGGCTATITKKLLSIDGVKRVSVASERGEVTVSYSYEAQLPEIKAALKKIGYPESGTVQGMEKITSGIASYVSCAIGKINSKTDEADKDHNGR